MRKTIKTQLKFPPQLTKAQSQQSVKGFREKLHTGCPRFF